MKIANTKQIRVKKHIQFYLVILTGITLLNLLFLQTTLEIELQVSKPGVLQVFWKDMDKGYQEQFSKRIPVRPGKTHYTLSLPSILLLNSLRVDPIDNEARVNITQMTFYQLGILFLRLTSDDGFDEFFNFYQIQNLEYEADGLHFTSQGEDPQFEMQMRRFSVVGKIILAYCHFAFLLQFLLYLFFAMAKLSLAHAKGETRTVYSSLSYLFFSMFTFFFFIVLSVLTAEFGLRWYYRDVLSASQESYFDYRSRSMFLQERNNHGFRGNDFTISPKIGVYRIVVMGDSFTWGQGVFPYTDRFTDILAQMLERNFPDVRFEVINLGRCGLDLPRHNRNVPFVQKLNPDFVLYQWYINDMEIIKKRDEMVSHLLFDIPESWHKTLLRHSVLYPISRRVLVKIIPTKGKPGKTYKKYMEEKLKDPMSKESIMAENLLNKLVAGFKMQEIPFGMVLFPEFNVLKGNPFGFLQDNVLSFCRNKNLQCLDLTPVYMSYQDKVKTLWANPFDAHPGKMAHKIAAEQIFLNFSENWVSAARQKKQ